MHKSLRIAVALSLLLPSVAQALPALSVGGTIAGLDAQATLTEAPAGDLTLQVLLPSGEVGAVDVNNVAAGTLKSSIPGDLLQEAGDYRAYVMQGAKRITGETSFRVLADAVDPQVSQMEADRLSVAADAKSAVTVTVTLRDQYGNVLPDRPVELVGSRLEDRITAIDTATDSNGSQRFSVTSSKAGTVFLRALDLLSSTTLDARIELEFVTAQAAAPSTGFNGDLSRYYGQGTDPWFSPMPYYPMYPTMPWGNPYAAQVTQTAAPAASLDSFEISISPKQPRAGQSFTVTLRAVGTDGKTAQDYVGTVQMSTPDDPDAVLPGLTEDGQGRVSFIPRNLGLKVMSLSTSFSTAGEHLLVAEDSTSVPGQVIRGELLVTVLGEEISPDRMIQFTSPTEGATVTNPLLEIRGKGPALRNLIVTGGVAQVTGETDENGLFAIPVELDVSATAHTLKVVDDSEDPKQRHMGELHLTLGEAPPDTTAAAFTASFSPASALEGDDVTLTVKSEESDLLVNLALDSLQLALTPDPTAAGTYTVLFRAPRAGTYVGSIAVMDNAGNSSAQQIPFTVQARELPLIRGLTAEPRIGGIDLLWEPLDDDRITSYTVYVGTSAQKFDFTLDTGKVSEGASVMGLEAGTLYYFTVAARADDRESAKSQVISAAPLGVSLKANPLPGSAQLTWQFPAESLSLQSFRLEYGIAENDLTERREVKETVRTMIVSDLIPGIPYTFRLTPIDTSGEALTDMAATATVTPNEVDYLHPAPSERLPYDNSTPPDNGLHSGAGSTTGSGLPASMIALTVLGGAATIILYSRRRRAVKNAEAFLTSVDALYRSL